MPENRKVLNVWVIYYNPSDYPNKYVARRWEENTPTKELYTADTLEGVRDLIPQGLYHMHRAPSDDPCIVETWI